MKAFAKISNVFPQVHESKQINLSNIQGLKAEDHLLGHVQYRKRGMHHALTP